MAIIKVVRDDMSEVDDGFIIKFEKGEAVFSSSHIVKCPKCGHEKEVQNLSDMMANVCFECLVVILEDYGIIMKPVAQNK